MATPTITSVSPTTGPAAGGFLAQIVGTNFKLPTIDWAIPNPAVVPTVSVKVGGLVCPYVKVRSATLLEVRLPKYVLEPTAATFTALSVRVANLQSDGETEVAGENATKLSAFTYYRWGIGSPRKDPPMLQVLQAIIQDMAAMITVNVSVQTHTDYAGDGGEATVIAEVPSIGLRISTPPDLEWRQWDMEEEEIEQEDGRIGLYKMRETRMLVLDLTLSGETPQEALLLEQAIHDYVNSSPELLMDADQDLYPGETDAIPLEISQDSKQASNPSNQNLICFTMQLRARGIPSLPDFPYEIVPKIAEFVLSQQRLPEGTPEETTFSE